MGRNWGGERQRARGNHVATLANSLKTRHAHGLERCSEVKIFSY